MSNLIDFTTPVEVRGVLGVSKEELEDNEITLDTYETLLYMDLDDISSGLRDNYATVIALNSPTSDQSKFIRITKAFSTYALAKVLLANLPIFSPKRITDGRAETERVLDPYTDSKLRIEALYDRLRNSLIAIYGTLYPEATVAVVPTLSMIGTAGIGADPVTGA